MKTSHAYPINLLQFRNQNGNRLLRKAMMLARISVFEIPGTKTKRFGRVFLPALALAVFCLISVNTARAGQRFTASLNGAQEVPPNGSTGTGYGSVILSDDQTTITVNLGFTGLGTNASDAHIHNAPVGVDGGIIFPLTGTPAATSGIFLQQTFAISPAQVTDLQNGLLYFNIHSGGFPGGEIRGQILLATCSTAGPIEVEATAGTFGPTAYASLNAAITAINAGTHQGSINVEVCGNTTETATASLSASGSGPTYTALNVYPLGSARTISGSIVGAIIKLNGADNVTIDGRIGGVGTGRDLTVQNNSNTTATAAIWLSSLGVGLGATNNTVRNLELACGAPQNTGTLSTFGIIMSGLTIATGSAGDDNDNNSFVANRIIRSRYGIVTRGQTANNNQTITVTDNIIGPSSFGADQIGKAGIFMQADNLSTVSRNTVQFVGGTFATTTGGADRMGIAIGNESWASAPGTITSANYTVTKNIVHDVIEERTFSAVGINLANTNGATGTSSLVANNFIYNVRANGTAGDAGIGLGIAGGGNDRVVFNSISMTGDIDPAGTTTATQNDAGIRVANANSVSHFGLTLQDNSILVDVNSNTAALLHYDIVVNSATYAFFGGAGGLNYNNYFFPVANPQMRTGGIGTTSVATTSFLTLANWQAALTPAQDANSIQADPLYFSNTSDLHLQTASPNVDAGLTIAGIADDIDAQVRPNGPSPDIGADEFYPSAGSLQFSSATFSATEAGGIATITVTRTGGANGAVQVDYATVAGGSATAGAACTAGVDYISTSATLMWADLDAAPKNFSVTLCADGVLESTETVNLALSNVMVAALGTPNTAVLTIGDSSNFSGSFNVGTAEVLTSLTNPGGVFDAINNGTVSGNVTFNITSDLTVETGTVALNQFAGGFTITIQPSGGGARLISGSGSPLINLNGADGVTFNGLNTGGHSLLIRNTNNLGATISIANDASNNSILNSTVEGGNTTAASGVIFIGTGPTTGNDNNTISGNIVRDRTDVAAVPANLVVSINGSLVFTNSNNVLSNNQLRNFTSNGFASSIAVSSDNWTITGNEISQTATRTTTIFGINLGGTSGTNLISGNTIHDMNTSGASAALGMLIGNAFNLTISRNHIYNFLSAAGATGLQEGIEFDGANATAASVNVVNNFVSIVPSFTNAQSVIGIQDFGFGGNTFTADHNSIYVGGTASGSSSSWALRRGTAAPTTYTARNNIAYNNRTGGTGNHFAGGDQSANTGTFVSNFNFYAGTGSTPANFMDYGTAAAGTPVSFAAWQAGPPARDANSVAGTAASFTATDFFVNQDAGDLHLKPTATSVLSAGTPIAGVTNDFDNDPRPAANPDIGADELVQAVGGVIPAGTFYNASAASGDSLGGNVTITNILYLNGILSTGANTLTIECNSSISGASPTNFVNGNLRKTFCATGVKGFEVGTANGYSPVSVNITAGTFPTDFTVKAVQGPQPNVTSPGSALQRYWTLTATGVTADLQFNYLDLDIPPPASMENSFVIFKYDGTWTMPGGSVNAAANTATINGVSSFSDWTLALPFAPTAAPATISGQVTTASGAPLPGVTMYLSGARSARTITDTNGNYRFVNVDTDNFYTVTPSILNYHFSPASRSFSLLANMTDAVFTGTRNEVISGNVIDTPEYFVRQHYLDFLGREPDSAGLNFWSDQILGCNNDFNCIERRTINVSAAYFLSIEFQETGGLVDGLYRASYGRAPLFSEFMPDTATVSHDLIVGQSGWEEQLRTNKQEFLDAWVQRAAFRAAYDNLSDDSYVDTLISHTGVSFTDGERAVLVSGLNNNTLSRAGVLRRIAENERFVRAKFNEAFVRMQYFGYLRRDPDDRGFRFWLNKLNEFEGNFERAEMVKAFLVSGEYRDRFRQ